MKQVNVGVIGTGWCGGIRAVAAANHPLVRELHIAEVNPERLIEMTELTVPASATDDWEKLIAIAEIDILMISATPETTHYPMTKAALEAGKHVLLEKPIALSLDEADDLIEAAESRDLKFTIAYSQRFNPKQRSGERPGQPPHRAFPRSQDRQPHQTVTGGDGSHPRHRFCPVVPRAANSGAGVLPVGGGGAQRHRRPRGHSDDVDHNGRRCSRHRRCRHVTSTGLPERGNHLDRVHRNRWSHIHR